MRGGRLECRPLPATLNADASFPDPMSKLLHVFPSFEPGGLEVRAAQLMAMMPKGTEHVVVAMDGRTGCMQRIPGEMADLVQVLPPPPKGNFLAVARHMAGVLKEQRPGLLLTYNWGSMESVLAARLAKVCPLVHHEDGFGPDEIQNYLRRRIWARRLLLPTAKAVVMPSMRLRDLALQRWKQPAQRVHYLPNGVDLRRFAPTSRQKAAAEPLVIGHVGHLRKEKNQALLLQAFALSKCRQQAELRLYGAGPEEAALKAMVAELGLHDQVKFFGQIADTSQAYAEMDVFALSSLTEQMPLTVLEAMASGLPVVSTQVGDVASMLADDNRPFLVSVGKAQAMAEVLDQLAANSAQRRALGAANRQHCQEHYEKQHCFQRFIDLYQQCMAD